MVIRKSQRFEIFKRDNFICQYCGHSSPEVKLELDHIIPKVKGGDDNPLNLITACFDCNRGKSKSLLTSKKAQINMSQQHKRLKKIKKDLLVYYQLQHKKENCFQAVVSYWYRNVSSYLSDRQQAVIKGWIGRFSTEKIVHAIEIANSKKLHGINGRWSEVFQYTAGILRNWEVDYGENQILKP